MCVDKIKGRGRKREPSNNQSLQGGPFVFDPIALNIIINASPFEEKAVDDKLFVAIRYRDNDNACCV